MIELKHIHIADWQSLITVAYTASLYFNGSKIGRLTNDGQGRADVFDGDENMYLKAKLWVRANEAPAIVDGIEIPATLEAVCAKQLARHKIAMNLKAQMERNIIIYRPADRFVGTYPVPRCLHIRREHYDVVRELCGAADVVFLNQLSLAEAAEIVRGRAV